MTAVSARPDFRRLRLDVGAEQRLADDPERQAHHVLRDVDCPAIGPASRRRTAYSVIVDA